MPELCRRNCDNAPREAPPTVARLEPRRSRRPARRSAIPTARDRALRWRVTPAAEPNRLRKSRCAGPRRTPPRVRRNHPISRAAAPVACRSPACAFTRPFCAGSTAPSNLPVARGLFHCPDERVADEMSEIAGAHRRLRRRRLRPPGAKHRPSALPPVHVAADREIRTVVGLRPFRSSGFCVRADRLGDKLVVHNYGHGGSGSRCRGHADLATRLALDAPAPTSRCSAPARSGSPRPPAAAARRERDDLRGRAAARHHPNIAGASGFHSSRSGGAPWSARFATSSSPRRDSRIAGSSHWSVPATASAG